MFAFSLNIRYTFTQLNITEEKYIKNKTYLNGILVITTLLVIGLACSNYGTKLEFNGGELYYTSNVTEADAKKLGEYLVKEGFFSGKKVTAQLDKAGGTYQVRLVILPEKQNDPQTQALFKTFAGEISTNVFNNAATEIHVCDDGLKTVKVITK